MTTQNQELAEGVYDIPKGYKAVVADGKITISAKLPRKKKPALGTRCITCKHMTRGYVFGHSKAVRFVCDLKPKKIVSPKAHECFFAISPTREACNRYEQKDYTL